MRPENECIISISKPQWWLYDVDPSAIPSKYSMYMLANTGGNFQYEQG